MSKDKEYQPEEVVRRILGERLNKSLLLLDSKLDPTPQVELVLRQLWDEGIISDPGAHPDKLKVICRINPTTKKLNVSITYKEG